MGRDGGQPAASVRLGHSSRLEWISHPQQDPASRGRNLPGGVVLAGWGLGQMSWVGWGGVRGDSVPARWGCGGLDPGVRVARGCPHPGHQVRRGAIGRPRSRSQPPAASDPEPVCEPNLSPLAPEEQKRLYRQQAEAQESAVAAADSPNLGPSKGSQKA